MTKEQEIEYVFKNKELLISKKKNVIKHGDVSIGMLKDDQEPTIATKADQSADGESVPTVLNAKLVINTTNLIDSHMDCHIPGIWNKSLKELGLFHLLQEHEMDFDKVIADSVNDNLTASVEMIPWKKLGLKYQGDTQALIFNAQIKKDVNEFMFNQYRKGRVLNHSVGMRYVKLFLCIDSQEASYSSEKANWDKYFPQVVNQNIATEKGYFWAVTEAKIIEGSAVVKGSNFATPSMEIEIEKQQDIEAEEITSTNEPDNTTQTNAQDAQKQFFMNLLNN